MSNDFDVEQEKKLEEYVASNLELPADKAKEEARKMLGDPETRKLLLKSLATSQQINNVKQLADTARSIQGTDPTMMMALMNMIRMQTPQEQQTPQDKIVKIIETIQEKMLEAKIAEVMLNNYNNKQDNQNSDMITLLKILKELGVLNTPNGNGHNDSDDLSKLEKIVELNKKINPLDEIAHKLLMEKLQNSDNERDRQLLEYINQLNRKIEELKNETPNMSLDHFITIPNNCLAIILG